MSIIALGVLQAFNYCIAADTVWAQVAYTLGGAAGATFGVYISRHWQHEITA